MFTLNIIYKLKYVPSTILLYTSDTFAYNSG